MIIEQADQHPDRHITVLCGHTHEQPQPRINVYVADATYRHPQIAGIIEIDETTGDVAVAETGDWDRAGTHRE